MKVKKVLSLALALVMIFTMIPAQLILSSANKQGFPEPKIGEALSYKMKISKESGKTGDDAPYNDLVKVEFQVKADYSNVPESGQYIATLGQVLSFDTAVLAPVSSKKSTRGQSTLDTAKTNAGTAPSYAWSKSQAGSSFALFATEFTAMDLDEEEEITGLYDDISNSALSYNASTGRMYVTIICFKSSGFVHKEGDYQTIAYFYLKPVEGATKAQIYDAIKLATEDELMSTTNGCLAPSMKEESYASTTVESARFVSDYTKENALPDDPAPAENPKITFNWKNANGDQTTGAVEYEDGATVTAPDGSTADYSDDDYDYEFTGWKNTAGTEYAKGVALPNATEDTTYTAQYKKSVDTTALKTEYDADKGLVETDYTAESWAPFAEALAAAKAIIDGTTTTLPTNQEVANALSALQSARANLEDAPQPAEKVNITFSWQNGAKSEVVETEKDKVPAAPQGAEEDYTEGNTKYIFAGWTDAAGTVYGDSTRLPAATEAATYTATYTEQPVTVKITFDVNGTKTEKDIPYGDMVTAQDAPAVQDYDSADGNYTYHFTGWDKPFATATEATTYTAQFNDVETNYADYDSVRTAIARANEVIEAAGNEYADMYTEASREALADALDAVVTGKLHSEQTTVDRWADDIQAAVTGLTLNDVKLTFVTHEAPSGIEKTYKYGDNVTDIPELQEYTDEAGFKWTPKTGADAWSPAVPATAKVAGIYTAQYTKEDAASLDDLQTAVANAIAKRDDGTQWTDDSVAALNTALAQADAYPATREYPASAQDDIDRITANINTAAANLTPKGATQFDVTFNWKGNNGEDKSDTTKWANGATPTAPQGAEDGYETTDYTYTFMRWEPSIIAVDGANQVYNAVYNEPQAKSAITTALEQAIADAQAKMAETDYQAKYTEGTRTALEGALATGQQVLDSSPLPSQQGTVDQATQAINDALSGMTRNEFTLKFYTHDNPNGITQQYFYGDPVTAPEFTGYSETDHDYTPKTGADAWSPEVPATATANGEYTAQYQEGPLKTADYRYNDIYSALAQAVVDTPNADKVYTQNYLAGVQDALNNNVQPGLPASQQQAVDDATQALANAISDPQYINYTIRFINEGQVISTSNTYHYDDTVTVPANPTKDPTAAKTFEFNGWTPEVTKVTGDQDYTATYTENDRYYTVTYNYHGGTSTEAVKYGDTAQNPPTVPTYYEGGIKYTFDHWNAEFAPVEGPQEYTAVYAQEQMPAVTVTFRYATSLEEVKDGHLTEEQQTVPYGDMPVIPDVQSFVDGDTTYKFDDWDKTVVPATEEATYTAVYTPVTEFTPDMSEIEALVARYNQMVKTGKYNKDDLKAVKAYIDEIYDTTFTSQDEVNEMARTLKVLEDSVRRIDVEKKETKKRESYNRRYSRTARTGDNATLVVMSVILVSSLGIAFISLKKRRENI